MELTPWTGPVRRRISTQRRGAPGRTSNNIKLRHCVHLQQPTQHDHVVSVTSTSVLYNKRMSHLQLLLYDPTTTYSSIPPQQTAPQLQIKFQMEQKNVQGCRITVHVPIVVPINADGSQGVQLTGAQAVPVGYAAHPQPAYGQPPTYATGTDYATANSTEPTPGMFDRPTNEVVTRRG